MDYTRERALPDPHTLTTLRVDRYLAATRELIEASEGAGAEYEEALRRYELALTHIGGQDDAS